MRSLGRILGDGRYALRVVVTIQIRIEGLTVLIREPVLGSSLRQLIDKVSQIGIIKIHIFVDIGET